MALGMIEVCGFVTSIVVADAAAKAADVKILALDKNKPAAGDAAEVPLIMIVKIGGEVDDATKPARVRQKPIGLQNLARACDGRKQHGIGQAHTMRPGDPDAVRTRNCAAMNTAKLTQLDVPFGRLLRTTGQMRPTALGRQPVAMNSPAFPQFVQ